VFRHTVKPCTLRIFCMHQNTPNTTSLFLPLVSCGLHMSASPSTSNHLPPSISSPFSHCPSRVLASSCTHEAAVAAACLCLACAVAAARLHARAPARLHKAVAVTVTASCQPARSRGRGGGGSPVPAMASTMQEIGLASRSGTRCERPG
jgi:hypothetical protein